MHCWGRGRRVGARTRHAASQPRSPSRSPISPACCSITQPAAASYSHRQCKPTTSSSGTQPAADTKAGSAPEAWASAMTFFRISCSLGRWRCTTSAAHGSGKTASANAAVLPIAVSSRRRGLMLMLKQCRQTHKTSYTPGTTPANPVNPAHINQTISARSLTVSVVVKARSTYAFSAGGHCCGGTAAAAACCC